MAAGTYLTHIWEVSSLNPERTSYFDAFSSILQSIIKQVGSNNNSSNQYSRGARFESCVGHQLSWLGIFLSSSMQMPGLSQAMQSLLSCIQTNSFNTELMFPIL
jgi:hypothetical protein